MDENIVETTEENPPVENPGEGEIESLFSQMLEKRDAERQARLRKAILELSEPQTETLDRLEGTQEGGTPERKAASGVRISRTQPTDPLYERLFRKNPALKGHRSPDLDHWNAHWLRAYVGRNQLEQQRAIDHLTKITGRAVTTYAEGALDASDPTAILSGSAGSFLPQPLANVVEIARDEVAVLAMLVQNFTMTSGTLRIPTASAFTVEMAAEGATSDEAGPTAASVMMKAQKMSGFAKITVEALADSAFNLVSLLGGRAGRAMGALEDVQICTTDGVAPNISGAIAGGNVDEATTTVLTYEDLVTLYFALGKVYRTNAVWLANSVTLTLLSTLMDGNDHPVLKFPNQQANVISDAPGAIGSLFNKAVYEVPLADGTLIYGDPSGYAFARRQGITIASSSESSFAADVVDFKITQRIDGQLIDAVALKQMAALATVA